MDLGADALADAAGVSGGACGVSVAVCGALLVVVSGADGVLAALDYLGDALSQLAGAMASCGCHGKGGPACGSQDGQREADGSLAEEHGVSSLAGCATVGGLRRPRARHLCRRRVQSELSLQPPLELVVAFRRLHLPEGTRRRRKVLELAPR